jgi:hypothetical protein
VAGLASQASTIAVEHGGSMVLLSTVYITYSAERQLHATAFLCILSVTHVNLWQFIGVICARRQQQQVPVGVGCHCNSTYHVYTLAVHAGCTVQ